MDFEVERIETLRLTGPEALFSRDLMSPYVWRPPGGPLLMLLRAVPRAESGDPTTGSIWLAQGEKDGLSFAADPAPLIAPGPGLLDIGGCEDPTAVPTNEACVVYYTGMDADGDGELLYASGPDVRHLKKRGVALASSRTESYTKEATVERERSGRWRLFYEYSRGGRSRVGLADGGRFDGPWKESRNDPFRARAGHWDCWHLSTGPLLMTDRRAPVMFYNGADKTTEWGVGWLRLSDDCTHAVARCDKPLIAPPSRGAGERDISFAASAIEEADHIWLYFSKNDRSLHRAVVRRTAKTAQERK
jgi:predicted GH43/DUF377 family glycosyl hydrolase